jgi:hypothetical protein
MALIPNPTAHKAIIATEIVKASGMDKSGSRDG